MLRYCKHTALPGAKQVCRAHQHRAIRASLPGLWPRAEPIIMESHGQANRQRRLSMASDLDYQALFATSVATSPRAAAGQLYPYDSAVGHPAAEAFPFQEFVEATARALDKEGRELAPYMPAEGHAGLRQIVARKMALHEHVTVSPDQLIIGNGSLQLIAMLIDCFVDPGDTVLTEEFTYSRTLRLLRRARTNVVGVAVDHDGIRMDSLPESLRTPRPQRGQPKLIYTLTNFH